MLRQIVVYVLGASLVLACSQSRNVRRIDYRFTPSDKVVFELLERLKTDPNDKEAAALLPDAYRDAAEMRANLNENSYQNMANVDRWLEIARQLEVAQHMFTEIKANPA